MTGLCRPTAGLEDPVSPSPARKPGLSALSPSLCATPCATPSKLPGQPRALVWTSRQKGPGSSTMGCDDVVWVQVRGCFVRVVPPSDLLWASIDIDSPHVVLVGLNRPFQIEDSPPQRPPLLDTKGLLSAPSRVDRVSLCDTSCGGQSGSRFHFFITLAARAAVPCSPGWRRQRLWFALARLASPCGSDSTHAAMPCLAVCPGPQRLGLCSSCVLSPACKLDAGGSLGQQCSP